MKRKLLASMVVSMAILSVGVCSFAGDDWRLWNTDTVSGKITEKLAVSAQAEFRWKNDMSDFYYNHTDLSLNYNLHKYWDIGGGYRQLYIYTTSWTYTTEPNIYATLKWARQDFKFSNQFRYAYKGPETAADFSEFRDNFLVVTPWKLTPLEINPYIGDFVYYHSNTSEWDENRVYAGVYFNIYGPVKGALYYLLQSVKTGDDWANYNTLGTAINVKF